MSKIIDVHGKVKYIHAVNLDQFGIWSVTIYPDTASIEVLRDMQSQGLKNVLKKDEDGYYMQFRRPPEKKIKGENVIYKAPKVVDKNGEGMNGLHVGHGSDVTVRLEVYPFGGGTSGYARGVAARWDSLKVNNLVKYEAAGTDWEVDDSKAQPLAEVPPPELW